MSAESEHIETASGPATRLLLCCDAGSGLQLGLSIDVGAGWPGIVLQLALQNTGASAVRVEALDALWWEDRRGELDLPGPTRALRWIDPGPHGAAPARCVRLRGQLRAACSALLVAPGFPGLTLGFLEWLEHCGAIDALARSGAPAELRIHNDLDIALPSGARVQGDRVWIGLDAASEDGLASWAERVGHKRVGARRAPLSAWCTGPAASAQGAIELARALREHELPVDAIRIDGGFAPRPGDWLEPSPAFPAGLEPVARELDELGFELALRIAPFVAARSSDLARAHREWLLHDDAGSTIGAHAVLDVGLEPVIAWLEALARGLRQRGVMHLWLDELRLGLVPGRASPAARYRSALQALRAGSGPEAFFAGIEAPFAASAGLLDALQIESESSAPRKRRWWQCRLQRSRDLELRGGLCGRLAHPLTATLELDSDDAGRRRRDAIAAAICGAAGFRGDPGRVSPEVWRLARRLLPPKELRPSRCPAAPGALIASAQDGSRLVALFEAAAPVDLSGVFGPGELGVFDAWRACELGRASGRIDPGPGARGVPRLLRVTPLDGTPRVLGSSLHLTAGAAELVRCEPRVGSGLVIELCLAGPRQGSIYLQPSGPGARAARMRVAFRDRLELCADVAFHGGSE